MNKKAVQPIHLTAFSAPARPFKMSSKTPSGQRAHHHLSFSQAKPAREKSCSRKVSIMARPLRRPVYFTKLRGAARQPCGKHFVWNEKGAFTGAVDQPGLFEQAHGGTRC